MHLNYNTHQMRGFKKYKATLQNKSSVKMSKSIVCVSISSILENSVDINEISDRQVKTNQVRSQLF